jgi:murein DD-endopeptidase MepM/ murein hydrolase activator NlpD
MVSPVTAKAAGEPITEVGGVLSSEGSFALTSPEGLTGDVGGPGQLSSNRSGEPACDPSQSTIYCVYTVQSGDTLSSIATKFGLQTTEYVASWQLLVYSNRPDIVSEDDLLQIGQKLRIPTQAGVIHEVVSDETLGEIASRYDVATEDILAVAANNLSDPDQVQRGQILLVPNPRQFSSGDFVPGPDIIDTGPASSSGFIWPATGPISSYFGPAHPLGIDIDLFNNVVSPIVAAAEGTVVFAGGNPCCSYGYYVVIDHGDGFETLYAHLSEIHVGVGQYVVQGQVLGIGGSTGYSTGSHLHFEVHNYGSVVDPLGYLP